MSSCSSGSPSCTEGSGNEGPWMAPEVERLVAYIRRTISGLEAAKLENEYEYSCVPLCIIDAVFSMGVRYESTRHTVREFCTKHRWGISRSEAVIEHTVSEFL